MLRDGVIVRERKVARRARYASKRRGKCILHGRKLVIVIVYIRVSIQSVCDIILTILITLAFSRGIFNRDIFLIRV